MNFYDFIDDYIKQNLSELKSLAVELCEIPSMTGNEEKKALYIKNKIMEYTGENADIDEEGNVIFTVKGDKSSRGLLLAAHIDTVFKDLYEIKVIESEGKLYAPSIMDNSINAAALLFIIKMIKELQVSVFKDLVFAFTVGEEGMGNLRGIRNVTYKFKDVLDGVIAVDCNLDSVVNRGVGSKRYEVSFQTKGGHSWADFGSSSAILYASKLVGKLYDINVPKNPKTTYNAGIISGGTSINTIAEDAEVLIDLRSEDNHSLELLDREFLKTIEKIKCDDVRIDVKPIGDRPCGSLDENSDLFKSIVETRNKLGLDNKFVSSSTDANIPLSLGIPAVSFGICRGGGTHTRSEFLYLDSIEAGIRNLAHLMAKLLKK
jgi:acetylornithine deacetylase/succinyl-diaminopimelate desuccinylase-like protein